MAVEEVSIWTVIQARLGSTRLPCKVLADIGGQTMLERVVWRAAQIGYPFCLTVPQGALGAICTQRNWAYIEALDEEDVLGRYVDAARICEADHVVRVTADCPFLDVEAAKWTVQHHLDTGADFTTYHQAEGRGVQVFTRQLLEESNRLAPRDVSHRHSPDLWVLHNPGRYHIEWMRFSVDTQEDLEIARRRVA